MLRFSMGTAIFLTLLTLSADTTGSAGTTTRVSVSSSGAQANERSSSPAVSSSGRFVAFQSRASNLVPNDTHVCEFDGDPQAENCSDVFVHDRDTGLTERVSVSSNGEQGICPQNGACASNVKDISADGRFVAFDSDATNLVIGDTNGRIDVFVRDRQLNTTSLVSASSAGVQGNGRSFWPSINASGRFVAFTSSSTNLVPGDTNLCPGACDDVFVRDLVTGVTSRVSVSSTSAQGNHHSRYPVISEGGRYVAFESSASNLVTGDTNGFVDIFLHDRDTDSDGIFDEAGGIATTRVNVSSEGDEANGHSKSIQITPNSRFIAFDSTASNLVAGDSNLCPSDPCDDVFVHDRQTGETERVSVSTGGGQANGRSREPSISADGRFVGFSSGANNLATGDNNPTEDVFVHDRNTGITVRVSLSSGGTQGFSWSFSAALSTDGRLIAFDSDAEDLVPGDTNNCDFYGRCRDVFVHDLGDADNDNEWDPFDNCPTTVNHDQLNTDGDTLGNACDPDDDNDGFSDAVETSVGTDPLLDCGVDAWPADINNDGFSDITDISALGSSFGKAVPPLGPAPARHNIAPDPPDSFVDITDISRMGGFFGKGCGP